VRRSSRLILLLGIFLAVGAFVLILFLNGGRGPAASPTPAIAHIVTAVVDIPQGTTITQSMITSKDVPLADAPADSLSLPERVIGKTARQSVVAGAYVPSAAVEATTAGTINVAPELKSGERAMALQVDELSGVGTLIQPGDRVDVVFTFTKDAENKAEIPPIFQIPPRATPLTCDSGLVCGPDGFGINVASTKVIVQNLRVVGTLVSSAATPAPGAAGASPTPGTEPLLSGRTELLIVALSAQQAEVLRFGQLLKQPMTLLLRSPEDAQASPDKTTGIILKGLIDDYGVLPAVPVATPLPTQFIR